MIYVVGVVYTSRASESSKGKSWNGPEQYGLMKLIPSLVVLLFIGTAAAEKSLHKQSRKDKVKETCQVLRLSVLPLSLSGKTVLFYR